MNFQTVRQVKGQKDDKNYPVKVDMFGTFTEIGGTAFNINQKPYSDCYITDDTSEKHKVRLYGDAAPTNLLGTRQSFSISAYDGNYQGKPYVGYSGFWNDRVPQQPQGSPQSPQNAPQGTKPPPGIDVESQILAIAERIVTAMEALCFPNTTALPHTTRPTQPAGPNPDYVGDDPPPVDKTEKIPF